MDEDRYQIRSILGKGLAESSYRAVDLKLDRDVTIRRFFYEQNEDTATDWEQRFSSISRELCKLSHPNLLAVIDAGIDDDGSFMITPLMDHDVLSETLIKDGPIDAKAARNMAAQLLDAHEAAHEAGFTHGTLTPNSILTIPKADGGFRYVIIDLGLFQLISLAHGEASAMSMMDEPVLLAPELFDNQPISEQSDCYSLGHIIYLSLAGGHPFAEQDLKKIEQSHKEGLLPPITNYRRDLHPEFIKWIGTLTEPDLSKRCKSIKEAIRTLPKLSPISPDNVSKLKPATKSDIQNIQPSVKPKVLVTAAEKANSSPAFITPPTVTTRIQPLYSTQKKSGLKKLLLSVSAILLFGSPLMVLFANKTSSPSSAQTNLPTPEVEMPVAPPEAPLLGKNQPSASDSSHEGIVYSNGLNSPTRKGFNITESNDWAVYQGSPIEDCTLQHPDKKIIRSVSTIGEFEPVTRTIESIVFFDDDGTKLRPGLFASSKTSEFAERDGWKIELQAPKLNENETLFIYTHFITWNCDANFHVVRADGSPLQASHRCSSHRENTALGTITQLRGLQPNETFFIKITAAAPKSNKGLGLSLCGVNVYTKSLY